MKSRYHRVGISSSLAISPLRINGGSRSKRTREANHTKTILNSTGTQVGSGHLTISIHEKRTPSLGLSRGTACMCPNPSKLTYTTNLLVPLATLGGKPSQTSPTPQCALKLGCLPAAVAEDHHPPLVDSYHMRWATGWEFFTAPHPGQRWFYYYYDCRLQSR